MAPGTGIRRNVVALHVCFSSILLACAPRPAPGPVVIPPGFTTCAEFTAAPYVDNYHPGSSFVDNGFTFDDPTSVQFINRIASVPQLGLQFPKGGLKITFPAVTTLVLLDMGGFASSGINIQAFNSTGASVTSGLLTADNTIHNVILGGPDIKTVTFSGGNNEGILMRSCIK